MKLKSGEKDKMLGMKLYKTSQGIILTSDYNSCILNDEWDGVINRQNLFTYLTAQLEINEQLTEDECKKLIEGGVQAPIGHQEVWAAGVTYLQSRNARMEESHETGGGDFYQKVYEAARPELFFKASPYRVAAHNEEVYIRKDSLWNVPEPELTLFINSAGEIQGYTIGNDMSSRDIEGENPLYLPQAKMYERSAALGPCLYVPSQPISPETVISIEIKRNGNEMFKDSIPLNRMKRTMTELCAYLFLECKFYHGCFLMTGTGVVPPSTFTLHPGDVINISIVNIGTLTNVVAIQQ